MPTPALTPVDVAVVAAELEAADPVDVVGWAVAHLGAGVVVLASFGDTVLVDVATRAEPDLEVVFVDTGLHFAETLETARRAQRRHRLELRVVSPADDAADLWAHGTDACCAARRVEPLERALAGRTGWISGLRRSDHPGRAATPVVEIDRRGLVKVNPLATLDDAAISAHVEAHGLVVNPLSAQGYGSIGCWPCTEPGRGRSGRWSGSARAECGIHT